MTNEPSNFHRAAWARNALAVFLEETWGTASPEALRADDLNDAVADLICDLLHFANQSSLDPEGIIGQATLHYHAELVEGCI